MTETQQSEAPTSVTLTLTATLRRKLVKTAQDEGVTLAELAEELVTEGLTLRAWEILERKTAMRAPSVAAAAAAAPGNSGNRRKGVHPTGWMEDKAAFLEYVRNQEKRVR